LGALAISLGTNLGEEETVSLRPGNGARGFPRIEGLPANSRRRPDYSIVG
jgi:hypothetical protein